MEVEESCSFRKKARDAWETLAEDPKTESGTAMETMVGESKLEVAAEMYKLDTAEIIGLLPGGMSGMDVLELGGGIGLVQTCALYASEESIAILGMIFQCFSCTWTIEVQFTPSSLFYIYIYI